jgi:hypothetical protein
MQPIHPHTFDPTQTTDALNNMAVGATVFVILMGILYLAFALYVIIMPLLIYVRLGRIARAVESSDFAQKSILIELKEFVALQHRIDSNASVQTTILKNLDQNLALGVNKALSTP